MKVLRLKNRASWDLQFFDALSNKKSIGLYVVIWLSNLGKTSQNPPSEKNVKQVLEIHEK
jgi:hypothetical protein